MSAEGKARTPALAVTQTKFRVPRRRRDVVRRDDLQDRLRRFVDDCPVTLVCAPAGSGKTTLLAELARGAGADEAVVWVGLDASDDDPARLLATLVQSLRGLDLVWELDPAALVGNVSGTGSEARAVLAGIVNALCTASSGRVLWILDDLHRVVSTACLGLLEGLIERLPQHVGLVLGSRTEPALPLARLRAHGDLADLRAVDLRFDAASVIALARSRGDQAPDEAGVAETLARTGGWAVGVNLMLSARGLEHRPPPGADTTPRSLFDFLAEEVLDELPEALRDFAIDCAILVELDPVRCQAVTGHEDSLGRLEALLRRHLFVEVIDERGPVLRFHDLFREFLDARLSRLPAGHRRRLHQRAAAVEPIVERAIGHWLDGGCFREAADRVIAHGLDIVAGGGHASVERWIERLPDELVGSEPRLALLRAECAWIRWDWSQVAHHARIAFAGAMVPQTERRRARLLLAAALGALGRLDERAALTEAAFADALPDGDAAQFHLQRAWAAFSLGERDAIAGHLGAMNALVARDPSRLGPLVAPTLNCHFGGLPGVTEAMLRFVALCETVPKPATLPWHSTPIVIGAWSALWQGRLDGVADALERVSRIQRSYGKVRYVLLDAAHLAGLSLAAGGRFGEAAGVVGALLDDLQSLDADGLRQAWLRPYRSVLSRIAWMASDPAGLRAQAERIGGPLAEGEWPFVAGAAATVQGQAALLDGDLPAAAALLAEAVARQARFPAPAFYADPRIALGCCHLAAGDPAAAWASVAPVLQEVARDRLPGRLLLEPRARVLGLLDACPPGDPMQPMLRIIRNRLVADPLPPVADPGDRREPDHPLRGLSDREREVLELVARGLPNKVLARQLRLSPHTVKRHLANILDKLDCDNRGQAAAIWRGDPRR